MNLTMERFGGQTRFDTAALIAGKLNSEKAVVANDLNFPDILSVSSYSIKKWRADSFDAHRPFRGRNENVIEG
ncbi:cell wall-binding repeat-containing protein [Planococcus citreus]|uniref:cell wall-binding repeat-containing protein n=1 Tax=Planococcus citreus TaxID=1373 RepID=UPI000EB356FE|nr:cell wall-binding repeat-containing protein [Planococcus citreus]